MPGKPCVAPPQERAACCHGGGEGSNNNKSVREKYHPSPSFLSLPLFLGRFLQSFRGVYEQQRCKVEIRPFIIIITRNSPFAVVAVLLPCTPSNISATFRAISDQAYPRAFTTCDAAARACCIKRSSVTARRICFSRSASEGSRSIACQGARRALSPAPALPPHGARWLDP